MPWDAVRSVISYLAKLLAIPHGRYFLSTPHVLQILPFCEYTGIATLEYTGMMIVYTGEQPSHTSQVMHTQWKNHVM
jgi:hypothetical protein